jgi:hypothetical protein
MIVWNRAIGSFNGSESFSDAKRQSSTGAFGLLGIFPLAECRVEVQAAEMEKDVGLH